LKQFLALGTLVLASLAQAQPAPAFGTYQKLFSADSLWNSYPVNPVFGTFVIPATTLNPAISTGKYSSGIFEAKATDLPMVIYPRGTNTGVWEPDGENRLPTITIPHWPASTMGATGSDGHADIVDATTNKVYSMFQLAKDTSGKWTAQMVAWSPLNGTGWGDPAHYYQGARAAGVPTSGGMIRIAEVNDGKAMFEHALAVSLDYTGLTAAPNHFVYPATSGDTTNPNKANTGAIPEGARVMLPPSFDLSKITDAPLLKVARTLKVYGAYVVDRNDNTPFNIYVENGANWSASPPAQLNLVRQALRRVESQDGHINGLGVLRVPESHVNLLSMRGTWIVNTGTDKPGVYDTFNQALVWGATTRFMRQINYSYGGLGRVKRSAPTAPNRYRLTVESTGGVKLSMSIMVGTAIHSTTQLLGNTQSKVVVWPAGGSAFFTAEKPAGAAALVRARLVELAPGE
jgi:hypothetical protein